MNRIHPLIQLSENDFLRLARLMTGRFGIKLPPDKRILFQSRLQTRLRQLQLESFADYCRYVFDPVNTETELQQMADLVSTNKTDFFREIRHFELLVSRVLPDLCQQGAFAAGQVLRCRSAGCSTGQEAWSVAMTLDDYREKFCPGMDYSILATDISSRVLKTAGEAIYPFRQSDGIPAVYLKKYVLKSKDSTNPRIRIDNRLRTKVTFAFENLMDLQYRNKLKFHLVFIRNTLIYFDRGNQERILKQLLNQMQPGGYLFVGHSESLINLDLPVSHVGASLYQKLNG